MRICILTFLLSLIGFTSSGQSPDAWYAFSNKDSTLIGFKDKYGQVKIKPKFDNFVNANKFDNIIAVSKENTKSANSYYLTKSGRIVCRNNLYIYDNTADCENEGFIRFRDRYTHKVGILNRKGNIAVPAEYNNLTRVRNGMIVGQKDAYWDKNKITENNQFPWVGGKVVLIDTNNKILVRNFTVDEEINFYSLQRSTLPNKIPIRKNFKAKNGKYYSFVNFDKEFRNFLKATLLNCSEDELLNASSEEIAFFKKDIGWVKEQKSDFFDRNFDLVKLTLLKLESAQCEYNVFSEGLNPYIFSSTNYEKYFNNCGESKDWIYPVKNLVITHKNSKNISQDQFDFLRTDNGYKLVSVSISEGEIK